MFKSFVFAIVSLALSSTSALAKPCVWCDLKAGVECVRPGDELGIGLHLTNLCDEPRTVEISAYAILPTQRRYRLGEKKYRVPAKGDSVKLELSVPRGAPIGKYEIVFELDEDLGVTVQFEARFKVEQDCE